MRFLMELRGDRLVARQPSRRQDRGTLYARNGPAVPALRVATVRDELYRGDVRVYVMDGRDSLDVDSPEGREVADSSFPSVSDA